jgi:hypothetical protein
MGLIYLCACQSVQCSLQCSRTAYEDWGLAEALPLVVTCPYRLTGLRIYPWLPHTIMSDRNARCGAEQMR